MPWSDIYFNEFSFANRELGDVCENGKKAIGLDPVYMEWGNPVYWGKFLLFCVPQSVKTKETNPTRPGCITLFCTLPSLHDYNLVVPTKFHVLSKT